MQLRVWRPNVPLRVVLLVFVIDTFFNSFIVAGGLSYPTLSSPPCLWLHLLFHLLASLDWICEDPDVIGIPPILFLSCGGPDDEVLRTKKMCPLPDDDNKDDIADTEGADKAKIHCFLQMLTYRELRMLALNAESIV